jgi:hypothetical protein
MKPYDFLALVPIVQGAGGAITNWRVRFWFPGFCATAGVVTGHLGGSIRLQDDSLGSWQLQSGRDRQQGLPCRLLA